MTRPLGQSMEKTPARHCSAQARVDPIIRLDHGTLARPASRTHGHSVALSSLARFPQAGGSGTRCHGRNHGGHGPVGDVEVRTPSGRINQDWEWELPALLPWPAPDGGAILRATSQMEIWPMAVIGGEASARAKETAPIPIVISDSSDSSNEGV